MKRLDPLCPQWEWKSERLILRPVGGKGWFLIDRVLESSRLRLFGTTYDIIRVKLSGLVFDILRDVIQFCDSQVWL